MRNPGADHAEHQRQVRYQTVVGAEYRCTETPRHVFPSASCQTPNNLGVDRFVGNHLLGSVGVFQVRGAGLCGLHKCQDPDGAHVLRHPAEETRAPAGRTRHPHPVTEALQPVLLVTVLGLSDPQPPQRVHSLSNAATG